MAKNSQNSRKINFSCAVKKPPFPPQLTVDELMANALEKLRKNKISKTPNAFLAYRMAFQKQFYDAKNNPTMRDLSLMATKFWLREPEHVKARYYQLIIEAKTKFEKICTENLPLQVVEYRPCLDLPSSQIVYQQHQNTSPDKFSNSYEYNNEFSFDRDPTILSQDDLERQNLFSRVPQLRTSTFNPSQNFWSLELLTTTTTNIINPISPIIDSQQRNTVEQGSPIVSQQPNLIVHQSEGIEKHTNLLNSVQNPIVDSEVLAKKVAQLENQVASLLETLQYQFDNFCALQMNNPTQPADNNNSFPVQW
ncbi:580_t:CDS:1 [Ambispora gerdemannii]|uniref:580_t:CDS:1 n=1 Tax=Ambispora gerdemannii TaxID=144530 RepID=A0A9N9FL40_9GLOM|nr:580_t:CDS:1 [Ambispora gerdemannii]